MLRNYFMAALRNLTRNKLVSVINIAGLAIGFAAAILIGLYLRYQASYESFLPGYNQVYRLSLTVNRPGTTPEIHDGADFLMSERLKLDYQLADTEPPSRELVDRTVEIFRAAGLDAS